MNKTKQVIFAMLCYAMLSYAMLCLVLTAIQVWHNRQTDRHEHRLRGRHGDAVDGVILPYSTAQHSTAVTG